MRPLGACVAGAAALALASVAVCAQGTADGGRAAVRFEIVAGDGVSPAAREGRMFAVLDREAGGEPREHVGGVGADAPVIAGRDVTGFDGRAVVVIDRAAASFPVKLSDLKPGEYFAQAVFDTNNDVRSINAPGNLYSDVVRVKVAPAADAQTVRLVLTHAVPPEQLPRDTAELKYIKIKSDLLSAFHKRPMFLRAAVLLPSDYDGDSSRRYPLRVHIGGYGESYTEAQDLVTPGEFRQAWRSGEAPRMILLHLDGDGPYGDSYQVNSANNGPYGDAITKELIPYVEQTFRALGTPASRALDGASTGGWVALALQIFYPDFFNGAWASCPDPADFRALQLLDIYGDTNAYMNEHGFDRPSARDGDGDVRFTMRHELRLENVLGAGDNWALSGEQWGAWNAVYGPRGSDGRPRPLWDPQSGRIDRSVLEHWNGYDLRLVLERNWPALAPKLDGRLNIWAGEADTYFLNNAVHLLEQSLSKARPRIRIRFAYGPGEPHCWSGLSELETMKEMGEKTGGV